MESIDLTYNAPPPKSHVELYMKLQIEMSELLMEVGILEAARRVGVGEWAYKVINVGLAVVKKATHGLVHRIMPSLEDSQLFSLSQYLEKMLFEVG